MLCVEYADWATKRRPTNAQPIDPKRIACKIDDDGVGGGVTDQSAGYAFFGVGAACRALDQEHYRNRRNELWFGQVERARQGRWSFGPNITPEIKREIKRQAMAPTWKVNWAGQKEVESKDETKKKIQRSPDGMDSVNLSFAAIPEQEVASWLA